ncbi:DUF2631 domain-containing protein [Gordonia sp. w5E2]|uniref:DUF2631 domain-containing protein n=1 Tax=Gordonia jacobaea TaxID=122202 RepID=A0ABR5IHF1_9ACTN|nr:MULTISPECIES: DUF2631 domain-containing protein [Gordonia]KNA92997.1 hypothetical protein ABW18_00580 [Gordonia jacobaea]OBC12836.1 hypothetical protein A5786_00815 [Gordonia sp. 852002-50816_SCH5313054-a]OBC18831.1 hypothetical protein A5788_01340 [Gordonia sp. 852002-50816_SCH5313054-c]SKY71578.1 Protein of uncharacterised function (DUF2631) [Mycobacteroides abscessus subsp. abscessus]
MASTEVEHEQHKQIDTGWRHEPEDAPSARFGWHGTATKSMYAAGWFCVAALLFMLIGNQVGHVEDIYLIVIAVALACILLYKMFKKKKWS